MSGSPSVRAGGSHRLPGLDGLRALAVVAVLLYHADYSWMSGGFLGVDLFFVLSGFLVTGLCLGERRRTGGIGLRRFWGRRIRRLVPAQLALLSVVVIFTFLFHRPELYELRGQVIAALTATTNWFLIATSTPYFDAIGRPPVLRHLWSLAIEMQFYLFWPPVLLVLLRRGRGRSLRFLVGFMVAGALVSSLLLWRWGAGVPDPSDAYYSTFSRLTGLLLGGALAVVWRPRQLGGAPIAERGREVDRAALSALVVVVAFFVFATDTGAWMYRLGFLVFAVASVVLVAATSHPTAKIAGPRAFGHPVLAAIGERSYGIYLWHWPIYAYTRPGVDVSWGQTTTFVVRIVLTAVVSELCYRFVELPWHRGERSLADVRRWFARPTDGRMARPLAVGGVTLLLAVGLVAMLLAPVHQDAAVASIQAGEDLIEARKDVPTPTRSSSATTAPETVPVTAPGETTSIPAFAPAGETPVVTAVGDSVMVGAAPGLYEQFGDHIFIDAKVARQADVVASVVGSLREIRGLGDVVVVHIGTNGTFTEDQIRAVHDAAGGTPVVFLTAHADRSWVPEVNRTLKEVVPTLGGAYLADWNRFSAGHEDWFVHDGVHLTKEGIREYATFVHSTVLGDEPEPEPPATTTTSPTTAPPATSTTGG
ncbi:MAG: acyltransferase [Actinobacteria bacterium]|nr:acyltransferase [Actinomycetota bacterium]